MQRPRRASAAEIYEQPDGQIQRADGVLIEERGIAITSPMITLAGTSMPSCRILYSAFCQVPSRARTSAASSARPIRRPSIETRLSPLWIPAFSAGLPGAT